MLEQVDRGFVLPEWSGVVMGGFVTAGAIALFFSAWVTHVVSCLMHHEWGFLIAGAIMFPIAIVHGVGIWFGIF